MIYLIKAKDYKDSLQKRKIFRQKHLKLQEQMIEEGSLLLGSAIIQNGIVCGSIVILNIYSPEELDQYLEKDPYCIEKIWESWEITPIQIGPYFRGLFPQLGGNN